MERNEFLSKLGLGVVAVCAGCSLASCGSKAGDTTSSQVVVTPRTGGTLVTADLNTELVGVGSSKPSNGILVVRIASANVAASFTAVQMACTHEGNPIGYNTAQGIFICPSHGSQFNTAGNVIMGPAASNLTKYSVAVTGTTLTVS